MVLAFQHVLVAPGLGLKAHCASPGSLQEVKPSGWQRVVGIRGCTAGPRHCSW